VLAHGCAGCRLEQSKVGAAVGPPSSSTYEYVESLRSLNGIRGLEVWKWSSRWSVEVEVGVVVRCAGRCSRSYLRLPSLPTFRGPVGRRQGPWVEGKDQSFSSNTGERIPTAAPRYGQPRPNDLVG